jgi:anti-sigma regulatory factor (Ser/Thr protein kinase)
VDHLAHSTSFTLSSDERSPREARGRLRAQLGERVPAEVLDRLLVVATELVSNAVRHGIGPVTVRASAGDRRVRVDVVDRGTGVSHLIRPRVGGEDGGFGLALVEELSESWGVADGTTHVWAEVLYPGS